MKITEADRLEIDSLSRQQRELIWHKVRAVEAVEQRKRGSHAGEVSRQAAAMGVTRRALLRWIAQVKKHGITGLIDGRVFLKTSN